MNLPADYGIFSTFYQTNAWGSPESRSGPGSELRNANALIAELPLLFERWSIQSVLDIPCGDWNWMQRVNLSGVSYIGADIVPDLIAENRAKYPQVDFRVINASSDALPTVDLIICRDLLIHLPYSEIESIFRNFKKSGSKYLLTTTFMRRSYPNSDVGIGGARRINLCSAPFNLPAPEEVVVEENTERGGADKCMALWDIARIPSLQL